jgi:hypothetical protein
VVLVVNRDYFNAYIRPVYDTIFPEIMDGNAFFRESSWLTRPIPGGLNFTDVEFRALQRALETICDAEVIITDIERVPPHEETALLPWTHQALDYVRWVTPLQMFECAMFSLSARWGMVVGRVGGYTCVGGEPDFIRAFVAESGGDQTVRSQFLKSIEASDVPAAEQLVRALWR